MGNPAFLPQSQGPGSPASALNPVQTLMDTELRVSSALTLLIHFFLLKTGVWGLWECPIPPPPPGYFAPHHHHHTHSTRPRPRADFPCPGPDAGSPASTSRAGASSREHGQPGQGSRPQLFCHLVAMLSIAPLNAPIACVLMTLLKSLQKSPNNDQLLPAADADAATLNSGGFTGQGGGPGPSV